MLQRLLADAKSRASAIVEPVTTTTQREGPKFNVATLNAISPHGLAKYHEDFYRVQNLPAMLEDEADPHVIMLRSHKLQVDEVPSSVRCIARCGAGTNNIPVDKMTELGIPVFNTPGANANAVKEAVLCGLLLSSRGIYEGIRHTEDVIYPNTESHAEASARIEKDKKLFVGQELTGKTLGVVGLGHIGGKVVEAALSLGMNVIGFDPALSLEAAWRLPGDRMQKAESLRELCKATDYISLHVPFMPATQHMLGEEEFKVMKSNVNIINFSRGELVDSAALRRHFDNGNISGKYVSDFADEHMQDHPRMIILPHLGASTAEAEDNSAMMAADTIKDFLETGAIRHSVNFPTANLAPHDKAARLCIVNEDKPGVLGKITTYLGSESINIAQQLNMSRAGIAYTVVDMENYPESPDRLQDNLGDIEGVLSSRFIGAPFQDDIGQPGSYYRVYS